MEICHEWCLNKLDTFRQALREALRRAQEAEEQAKDLGLRLFAKKVVRMRNKVRRLSKKGTVTLWKPTQ